MSKANSLGRRSRAHLDKRERQSDGVSAEARFPPLSTSLRGFVKDGSDHKFRQLIHDLTRLSKQMARNRGHFAAYIGVSEPQLLMMTIIAETQGATVSQIAQQLSVSSQFVTNEISDLIKKNIVEKQPNEADRRSMFLNLTAKGKSLFCEMAPLRQKANDIHFRSLTEDRARVLQEIIAVLISDGMTALHELEAPDIRGQIAPSAQSKNKKV
jgi:MarR family transcriptional regulator, organic hydroperoxide resistance regulator